ncbi:MAG: hypothetical protein HOV79_24375 [Hamadaea sp.]|nr:hypothetical protein [Hamadaea sp.]
MLELGDLARPESTTAEIVVKMGTKARVMVEVDDEGESPPVLCIMGDGVQLMIYPQGWTELGEVQQCDLDRASDLVIDATRFRDAILGKLKRQRAEDERREAALRAHGMKESVVGERLVVDKPRNHEVI